MAYEIFKQVFLKVTSAHEDNVSAQYCEIYYGLIVASHVFS